MQEKENVYDLIVNTGVGEKHLCVKQRCIEYEDDDLKVKLSSEINGRMIQLEGDNTEYLLYRLSKMLPDGWTIKCCLSCRHGNFCPVGDYDNEIFCVSDFEPKQKSDLYEVTENENERMRRSRNLFHVCGKYVHQSADYYTYSSYLHEVHGIEE